MPERPERVYADTSVYGGVFDEEFATPSRAFFGQVRAGRFRLVLSAVVRGELVPAPTQVQEFYRKVLATAEVVEVTEQAHRLQEAYVTAGIVSPKAWTDALHVALATVARCPVIVSWNFRHIVHYDKIALYNQVNDSNGYARLAICSPHEVIDYDDQDV